MASPQKTTDSRRYFFDLETDGLLPELTKIHSLVLIDADTGELESYADDPAYLPISAGLQKLRLASEIIGHNVVGFDIPAIQKIRPDWEPQGRVLDTLILARLLYGEIATTDNAVRAAQQARGNEPRLPGNLIGSHSLKAWGLRLGFEKGQFGDTADWSVWTPEMQAYCEQDVRVTEKLFKTFAAKNDLDGEWAFSIDLEHRFARLIGLQERHGFRFDVKAAEALEAQLRIRKASLEDSLMTLFDPWWVPVGVHTPARSSRRWVQAPWGGVVRTVNTPTGETYTHTFKTGRTVVKQVTVQEDQRGFYETTEEGVPFTKVELRVFNPGSRKHIADRLTKLYGWKPEEFTPSGDPKIDDEVLSDLPYPPAKVLAEYFMVEKRLGQVADGNQAWLKKQRSGRLHGRVNTLGAVTGRCTHSDPNVAQVPSLENAKGPVPYGTECRSLFLPDEGHVLLGCDAAGLELRCLAHFMRDGGRYANIVINGKKEDGTDIHTQNQQAAGLPSRAAAKTFIYAFLYGAGDVKIGSIVSPSAPENAQRTTGKRLKKTFLDNTPGLKGLIDACKTAAETKGWLKGIDGRRIPVRSSHAALNSLLQNAGAVAMKLAPVLLYERLVSEGYVWGRDFAQVAHIHDEMQISVRPEIAEYVAEAACWSIEEAGKRLGFACPLAGEAGVGKSWKETH